MNASPAKLVMATLPWCWPEPNEPSTFCRSARNLRPRSIASCVAGVIMLACWSCACVGQSRPPNAAMLKMPNQSCRLLAMASAPWRAIAVLPIGPMGLIRPMVSQATTRLIVFPAIAFRDGAVVLLEQLLVLLHQPLLAVGFHFLALLEREVTPGIGVQVGGEKFLGLVLVGAAARAAFAVLALILS